MSYYANTKYIGLIKETNSVAFNKHQILITYCRTSPLSPYHLQIMKQTMCHYNLAVACAQTVSPVQDNPALHHLHLEEQLPLLQPHFNTSQEDAAIARSVVQFDVQ